MSRIKTLFISIDGIEIKVDVRERHKRVVDDSFPYHSTHYINIPSGILCFMVGDYDTREWDDKKNIESQFPRIFTMLETFASERKCWRIEAEKQRVQQEKKRKIRLEQYQN